MKKKDGNIPVILSRLDCCKIYTPEILLLQTNEKVTSSVFFIKKMINNDRQMRGKINLSTKLSFVALGPLV